MPIAKDNREGPIDIKSKKGVLFNEKKEIGNTNW